MLSTVRKNKLYIQEKNKYKIVFWGQLMLMFYYSYKMMNIILNSFGSAVIDIKGKCEYTGIIKKEKRFDIVVGLPASGKSSTIVNEISQKYSSRLVDSDEAKKLLPDFNNGWGGDVVHRESQKIALAVLKIAMLKDENIVLPKVGGNIKK